MEITVRNSYFSMSLSKVGHIRAKKCLYIHFHLQNPRYIPQDYKESLSIREHIYLSLKSVWRPFGAKIRSMTEML